MSHAGNWHRNPRKLALETSRLLDAMARQAAFGRSLTPRATRAKGWGEHSLRCGCRLSPVVAGGRLSIPDELLDELWITLMAKRLYCRRCGQRPTGLCIGEYDRGRFAKAMVNISIA